MTRSLVPAQRFALRRVARLSALFCLVGTWVDRSLLESLNRASSSEAQPFVKVGLASWRNRFVGQQRPFQLSGSSRRVVEVSAAAAGQGFAPKPSTATGPTVTVDEPKGGWPTLSVLLLNPDGTSANSLALDQMALQDYPKEQIREIVVAGAEKLKDEAPAELKPLLRDLQSPKGAVLDLHSELAACSGDFVAVWGDDHVSPPERLRAQVAAAASGGKPTILQARWFFDPVQSDFFKVTEWPDFEVGDGEKDFLPKGYSKLMVSAETLTLCGNRKTLVAAAQKVASSASPSNGLKELLLLLAEGESPTIIDSLEWASMRAPPSLVVFESAMPESGLEKLVRSAWLNSNDKDNQASLLDTAIAEIDSEELRAPAMIEKLLAQELTKSPTTIELQRVKKVMADSFTRGTGGDVAQAISTLSSWYGLQPNQADDRAVHMIKVFFAMFAVLRTHITEEADLFDMKADGEIAEGLMILGSTMWGCDGPVQDVMTFALIEEVYKGDKTKVDTDFSGINIVGTLGLREPLTAIAYGAVDVPGQRFPVSALVSLAWGLGKAKIDNSMLQIKVAKAIIADCDKLTPPDIGKLFVAMDEFQWFKDDSAVGYLTEALLAQVREIKKRDPGLANILATSAAAA